MLTKLPLARIPQLRRWPKLPRAVTLAGGRVKIRLRRRPKMEDTRTKKRKAVLGYFDSASRTVVVDSTLPPAQRWATLFHELAHVALFDTGADNGLRHTQEERIAEAVSLALLHQMRYALRLRA